MKKVGVLALQGDFAAHAAALERAGAEPVLVREREQLADLDGLILPGGESTTMLKLMHHEGLMDALAEFGRRKPLFGTCAGAILLATEVKNPKQDSLALLDMTVMRNGYGRQVHSDVVSGPSTLRKEPLEMVFIRGPVIERVGRGVEVLAEYAGKPALVEKGRIMASAFHPELTSDTTVHDRFVRMAAQRTEREVKRANGTRT